MKCWNRPFNKLAKPVFPPTWLNVKEPPNFVNYEPEDPDVVRKWRARLYGSCLVAAFWSVVIGYGVWGG